MCGKRQKLSKETPRVLNTSRTELGITMPNSLLPGCVLCGGAEDEGDILQCELCDLVCHAVCVGFKGRIESSWVCAPCALQEEEEEEEEEEQGGDAAAAA